MDDKQAKDMSEADAKALLLAFLIRVKEFSDPWEVTGTDNDMWNNLRTWATNGAWETPQS